MVEKEKKNKIAECEDNLSHPLSSSGSIPSDIPTTPGTNTSTTTTTSASNLTATESLEPEIQNKVNDLCALAWKGDNLVKFKSLLQLRDANDIPIINHYNSRGQTALVNDWFSLHSPSS